jgi:TctA family transporter
MDVLFEAFVSLLSPAHFLALFAGTLIGLVVGILPGLGGTAGLALIIPFLFGLDPSIALAMMIGLIAPGTTSDTLPAVLMGIPGSSSAQATVLDGFPLSKRGEAARALGAAFTSSLFGGLFGAVVLTGAIFVAEPIILSIGFGEQWLLVVLALTMVGLLTGPNIFKGLASCGLGLMLGVMGWAPATGQQRLTFGEVYLFEGLPIVVVGLALFAFPEILDGLRRYQRITEEYKIGKGWYEGFKDALRHKWLLLRCSGIGCLIGALPGLGGSVASWVAYSHAVQSARDRSGFGQGDIRGVIAPESSNNAVDGGTLIPTLLFAIPGSASMAVILGGFETIGIQPGASLVSDNLDLTYVVIWSLAIANVLGAGICLWLAGPISRMTTVPYALIAPMMLAVIFFGAFQATRNWGDLIALLVLGVVGCLLKRFGWSRPAVVIGFFLSTGFEQSTYRALQVYGLDFFARPQAIIITLIVLVSVWGAMRLKGDRPSLEGRAHEKSASTRKPQALMTAFLMALTGFVLYDAMQQKYLAQIFPAGVSILTFALLSVVLIQQLCGRKESSAFHDNDLSLTADTPGFLHYLLWILGLLVGIYVVGLPIAICLFIFVFTTVKAGRKYLRNVVLALGLLALISVLTEMLTLRYPPSLLRQVVDMPWWLGG